jgi:hypothetical protein
MVSAFLVCLLLWYVSSIFFSSSARMILADSLTRPEARPYLALYLVTILVTIVGLLGGGILGSRPKEPASAPLLALRGIATGFAVNFLFIFLWTTFHLDTLLTHTIGWQTCSHKQ